MNIIDRVFVVTGAGNGIGREVTLRLLAEGAAVADVDLSAQGLEATAALRKGSYRATVGGDAAAMDRLSRLSPRRATTLIAKQMSGLLD